VVEVVRKYQPLKYALSEGGNIMFCGKCGKDNAPGAAFCTGCGAALAQSQQYIQPQQAQPAGRQYAPCAPPQQAAKPAGKKNAPAIALGVLSLVLAVALALSFLGVFGGAAGAFGTASKGFGTPEEAINYFVERLKNNDFDGALAACAIDEMARNYDYIAFAERIGAIQPIGNSYLPSEYSLYVEYNRHMLAERIMTQIASCIAACSGLPEEYYGLLNGKTMPLQDRELPDDLIEKLDPANIKDVELLDIGKSDKHDTKQNRDNQKKQAKIFGADDIQFRSVLYGYDGDYYMGGFTLIEYGGKWYIQNMMDPLAGIPYNGLPIKLSGKEEFESMLG
jgi:hypothetical protein